MAVGFGEPFLLFLVVVASAASVFFIFFIFASYKGVKARFLFLHFGSFFMSSKLQELKSISCLRT